MQDYDIVTWRDLLVALQNTPDWYLDGEFSCVADLPGGGEIDIEPGGTRFMRVMDEFRIVGAVACHPVLDEDQ